MADDLTLGELGRRLEAGLSDLKDDLHQLGARLDGKVDAQVLSLQQAAQDERHQALVVKVQQAHQETVALRQELAQQGKEAMKREDAAVKQLRDYRRWLVGAIVVPVLAVLLPLLLTRGKL